jgi:CheY-like chemotaxis protein
MQDRRGSLEIALSDTDFDPDVFALDGEPKEFIQIMIKDTGVGMSPEVMKRIFEPFYTTRQVGEGSGMGLAVIYGIVRDLGGTITVESKPERGSTFRVFLPKAKAEIKGEARQIQAARGTERVLFVDDEPLLVEWGRQTLEKLGYTATAVADARQALEIFAADPSLFDLIITDQAMPGMSGSDLSMELLRIRNDIAIILCTGHSESVTGKSCRNRHSGISHEAGHEAGAGICGPKGS